MIPKDSPDGGTDIVTLMRRAFAEVYTASVLLVCTCHYIIHKKTKNFSRLQELMHLLRVASSSRFFMVALWNRETIYIFMLWFVLLSSFFSSPNLSGRRLDVYHTLAHGVALVRI